MYKIEHTGYTNNEERRDSEYFMNTAEEAAEKLIDLSYKLPISYIELGKREAFEVRKKRCGCREAWCRKWSLDYSKEELVKMIREALPDGGMINAWHNPWAGLP
jgi:hypothetical protein